MNPPKHIEAMAIGQMQIQQYKRRKRIKLAVRELSFSLQITNRIQRRWDNMQRIENTRSPEHDLHQVRILETVFDYQNRFHIMIRSRDSLLNKRGACTSQPTTR